MKWNPATRRRDADGNGMAWKGGRHVDHQGYVRVFLPDHPHADTKGYAKEHLVVVTAAMGKPLRAGAEVHHFDEDKTNNGAGNLVACDSRGYHLLLHLRTRALNACGHPDWRRCSYCKRWAAPQLLYIKPNGQQCWHRTCARDYKRQQKAAA
ncbi:MAG: HNH endonuclease [Gemmatimonadaceae bacterium]